MASEIDDVKVIFSLEQIEEEILKRKGCCANCGARLKKGSIRSSDHPEGIEVKGFQQKQWVYFHCSKCGIDSALWKVLQLIYASEKPTEKQQLFDKAVEEISEFVGEIQRKHGLSDLEIRDILDIVRSDYT